MTVKYDPRPLTRVCKICMKQFTFIHSVGRYPSSCPECKLKYRSPNTRRRKVAELANPKPPVYRPPAPPITHSTRDESTTAKQVAPDISYTSHKDGIKLVCPKDKARIITICDHVLKYAECEIQVMMDGEISKVIHIAVNAQGWSLKASAE